MIHAISIVSIKEKKTTVTIKKINKILESVIFHFEFDILYLNKNDFNL